MIRFSKETQIGRSGKSITHPCGTPAAIQNGIDPNDVTLQSIGKYENYYLGILSEEGCKAGHVSPIYTFAQILTCSHSLVAKGEYGRFILTETL